MQMTKDRYLASGIGVFDVIYISLNGKPSIKYRVKSVIMIYDDLVDIDLEIYERYLEKEAAQNTYVAAEMPTINGR